MRLVLPAQPMQYMGWMITLDAEEGGGGLRT